VLLGLLGLYWFLPVFNGRRSQEEEEDESRILKSETTDGKRESCHSMSHASR
jgi:hypothetical protein